MKLKIKELFIRVLFLVNKELRMKGGILKGGGRIFFLFNIQMPIQRDGVETFIEDKGQDSHFASKYILTPSGSCFSTLRGRKN